MSSIVKIESFLLESHTMERLQFQCALENPSARGRFSNAIELENGQLLSWCTLDSRMALWNHNLYLSDDTLIRIFDLDIGHIKSVISMDNGHVAILSDISSVMYLSLWDSTLSKEIKRLIHRYRDFSNGIIIKLHNGNLAYASYKYFLILSKTDYKCIYHTALHHSHLVTGFIELKDGRIAIASRKTITIYKFEDETLKSVNNLYGHEQEITYITELRDGRLLSSSMYSETILWNMEKYTRDRVINGCPTCYNAIRSVAFPPDTANTFMAVSSCSCDGNIISIWKGNESIRLRHLASSMMRDMYSSIILLSTGNFACIDNGIICIFDMRTQLYKECMTASRILLIKLYHKYNVPIDVFFELMCVDIW